MTAQTMAQSGAASVIRVPGSTHASGDLLTLDELATRLQVHPDTARRLYKKDVLPGLKLGHRTLRFDYGAVLDALRLRQAAK